MPDPTVPQCDCGWLEDAAEDPDVPVVFDAKLNEFQIVRTGGLEGRKQIYHCPFCGGSAPKSKRDSLFAYLTTEELHRLSELSKDVSTVAETVAKFGSPDEDLPYGYGETTPSKPEQPGRSEFFRVMRYNGLSETAIVDVVVYPGDRVSFTYLPKYIGGHDG